MCFECILGEMLGLQVSVLVFSVPHDTILLISELHSCRLGGLIIHEETVCFSVFVRL